MPLITFPLESSTFDVTKLEYEPETDFARGRLALKVLNQNDFSVNLGELSSTVGAGSVNVVGGRLEINGQNAWDANGVFKTALVPFTTPGSFEIKVIPRDTAHIAMVGFAAATAIDYNDLSIRVYFATDGIHVFQGTEWSRAAALAVVGTQYTITAEWDATKELRVSILGGTFATKTLLASLSATALGANIGFQAQVFTNLADAWEFEDYMRKGGYWTDNPVWTLANYDAGTTHLWDMSTFRLPGLDTGLTFDYAYGAAPNPVNWSGYLTLANLRLETDVVARHFRIRIKVGTDGVTQREITMPMVNAACLGLEGGGGLNVNRKEVWVG